MEFYWLVKPLISLSMEYKNDNKVNMDESLDKIRCLEAKFTILKWVEFGISFKVTDWDPDNEHNIAKLAITSSSPGTNSNPTFVEEELETNTNGKVKTH